MRLKGNSAISYAPANWIEADKKYVGDSPFSSAAPEIFQKSQRLSDEDSFKRTYGLADRLGDNRVRLAIEAAAEAEINEAEIALSETVGQDSQ